MLIPCQSGYKYAQPYLEKPVAGLSVHAYEYNETRGHTYALNDLVNIDPRINRYAEKGGLPATCWNCKTPKKMMDWIKEYGDKFWAMDVNSFRAPDKINEIQNSISCATCRDPATMELGGFIQCPCPTGSGVPAGTGARFRAMKSAAWFARSAMWNTTLRPRAMAPPQSRYFLGQRS